MIFYIGFIFIIKFIGIKLIGVIMVFFFTQLNNINTFKSKRLRGVFFFFQTIKKIIKKELFESFHHGYFDIIYMNEEQINLLKHIKKINKKNKFNAPASKHRSCHSNSTCNI